MKESRPYIRHAAALATVALVACGAPSSAQVRQSLSDRCGATIASQQTIPLPAFVTRVRSAGFVQDAAAGVTFQYVDARDQKTRIGYVLPDGSSFACVSCAAGFPTDQTYLPGDSLPDGARMLLSAGENNSTSQIDYAILECAPSIAQCAQARVLPIRGFPAGPRLQDRVPKLTPDGSHLLWTRIRTDGYFMVAAGLTRSASEYTLGAARVLNPPSSSLGGAIGARRVRSSWYEAKSVSYDGATLAFAGTLGDSLNLDWFTLSLETGELTRLTRDGDWDEGGQLFPGNRFMTGGSSRGLGVTAALGAFPRPSLYDHAVIGAITNAYIPRSFPLIEDRPRASRLVQHVLDRSCADTDAAMVAVGDESAGWIGNGGGGTIWARDGVRFVNNEKRADDPTVTRLSVVTLDAPPQNAGVAAPLRIPAWAPLLEDVELTPTLPFRSVLHGPGGGRVTLLGVGDMAAGAFEATYVNYVTEDGTILNGCTRATVLNPLVAHVQEDLRATGSHVGTSSIDVWFADTATTGDARTELDGRVFARHYESSLSP